MSSFSRQQLEEWVKTIEVKGRVLDIGGAQLPVKKRLGRVEDGTEFIILDLETPHLDHPKPDLACDIQQEPDWWYNGGDIIETDKNKIKLAQAFNQFDMAFCLEVSEYWYDPLKALKNIGDFLKQDGILYISFHTVYPEHNPKGQDCLRYTRSGVIKLLEKSGFKIEQIVPRVATTNLLEAFYRNEKMRGPDLSDQTIGLLVKAIKE